MDPENVVEGIGQSLLGTDGRLSSYVHPGALHLRSYQNVLYVSYFKLWKLDWVPVCEYMY